MKTKLLNKLSPWTDDANYEKYKEIEAKINSSPIYLIMILATTNIIILKILFLLI